MVEVVLFHHALGLTQGVIDFAETLRKANYITHTPDLYKGRTFDRLEDGIAHVNGIGFDEFLRRGEDFVLRLPINLVYIGLSLGVIPAQKLAQTRSGALGAVFLYSCLPISEFSSSWPEDVPVQIHAMEDDPFFVNDGDIDSAREFVKDVENAELFLYKGDKHIFADRSLQSYNENASRLLMKRILDFLELIEVKS